MTDPPALYEQIKDDLGYLQLGRAAEMLRRPRRQARPNGWIATRVPRPLVAEQAAATTNRRLAARLRYARFPYRRTIEDFDFDFQPSVDRKLVDDLASLRFIDREPPDPVPRPTRLRQDPPRRRPRHQGGRGRLPRLLHHRRRHGRRRWPRPRRRHLRRPSCAPTPPRPCSSSTTSACSPCDRDARQRVLPRRQPPLRETAPTLVTTNRGLPAGARSSATTVVAAAILDRLLHRAVVFNIRGPSWRLREHQALAEATSDPDHAPTRGGRRGNAETPSRNDGVTIPRPARPAASPFVPSGRRRHCSDACRQAAWRRRHQPDTPQPPAAAQRPTAGHDRLPLPQLRHPRPRRATLRRLQHLDASRRHRRPLSLLRRTHHRHRANPRR